MTIFQIVDDSDTDDNNKLPVGSSHSTTLEPPCDRGGQLIDDIMTVDVTCAHNSTMPVAYNNNTTFIASNNNVNTKPAAGNSNASDMAGLSQEISWRADASYKWEIAKHAYLTTICML